MHFQQWINEVPRGLPFIFGYLDNILILSENTAKSLQTSKSCVFYFINANLKSKRTKCDFFKCEPHYLSHVIYGKGIYPLPEILQIIKDLPVPRIPKEVRQMLHLTGNYCKFIPAYEDLVQPLTQLTHKMVPFIWTDLYQKAFDVLKEVLMGVPH